MRFHHLVFLISINIIWGFNFIAVNYVVADLSPVLSNASRFMLVALALAPFLRIIKGQMRQVLWVATVLGVFHFGMFMLAMSLTGGVSELAIVNQLSVPFSTILAVILIGEVVHLPRIMGITISFLGVMIMGFEPHIFAHMDAVLVMAMAAFLVSYATILMRKLRHVKAMTIQAWVALVGFSGSVILSIIFESGQVEALKTISSSAVWGLLYSAIGASVIGHGGVNYLLRHYEVSVISPYMVLTPVFGVVGGVFVLGEILTTRMVVGAVLTLIGVLVITFRNSSRRAKVQANTEII